MSPLLSTTDFAARSAFKSFLKFQDSLRERPAIAIFYTTLKVK